MVARAGAGGDPIVTATVEPFALRLARDPHAPLAAGAALVLACEGRSPLVIAALAAGAIAVAWRRGAGLRLRPVVALAIAFQLAWSVIHLAHGVRGDADPRAVYGPEGHALLHGTYPHSPYPAGAVALFALEALLPNALAMVPFQALVVVGVWQLRTRWSGRLAACVALWPANAFFWEYRFDLVPAAAIVGGIALARDERWGGAGWAFGLGALAKWTPGLTALALAGWLLAARRPHDARRLVVGAALPLVLVDLPLFMWAPGAAVAPYRAQSVRGITGESLPYLLLRPAGLARPGRHYYGAAHVPAWTTAAAALVQLLAVAAVVVLAARAPSAQHALARAALAPAVFLLANRIFSPQFFVVVLAACVCAAALVLRRQRQVVSVAVTLGVATTANAVLYPGLAGAASTTWTAVSAAALVPATCAVAYLATRRER